MALTQGERTTFQVKKKNKKKTKQKKREDIEQLLQSCYLCTGEGTYYMVKNAHFVSHAE